MWDTRTAKQVKAYSLYVCSSVLLYTLVVRKQTCSDEPWGGMGYKVTNRMDREDKPKENKMANE